MLDASAPLWFLNNGEILYVQQQGEGIRLQHLASGEHVYVQGLFKQRLIKRQALPQRLYQQYPWLTQLSQATTRAVKRSDVLRQGGLQTAFIELLDTCNERCLHCYASSSPEATARLSWQDICSILKQLAEHSCAFVQFTGGDPLLHPQLLEAVAYAHHKGIPHIEIYTNGVKLTKAMIARLEPYQPQFAFSIYAADAETHDRITQLPGSWKRSMQAIQSVIEHKLAWRVGMILMPENQGKEAETYHFLQQKFAITAAQFGIDTVKQTGRGAYFKPEHIWRPAQTAQSHSAHAIQHSRRKRGKLCFAANGNIYPCIFSRQTILGNIREKSLTRIFEDLDRQAGQTVNTQNWQQQQTSLSCVDCQAIACALQTSSS